MWVPGDTQKLPKLPGLRYSPFSPAGIPGKQAEERGWEAGRPRATRRQELRREEEEAERGGRGTHFRVVPKSKERYEMGNPRYAPTLAAGAGGAAPEPIPDLEPFHTAAYSLPSFSTGGGGRAYSHARGTVGGGGGGGGGGGEAIQMPGFIVATTDDASSHPRSSAPASRQRQIIAPLPPQEEEEESRPQEEEEGGRTYEAPPTRVVIDVKQAAPSPTRMEEVPIGSNGHVIFPVPTSALPPQEYQLQPVVSSAPHVTVTVHRPAAPAANLKPGPEVHPELTKIPKLPHLKYFSDEDPREPTGTFRHWDGKTLQVLNVVPETPEGAIDLDPHNWYQPKAPVGGRGGSAAGERGFAPPLEQAREGKYVAAQAKNHFVGADRSEVGYQPFGEVGRAVGEEEGVHSRHMAAGMQGAYGR